jgi:putative endonuclease
MGQRIGTPVGEIDLVAKRRRKIAFVEVKARATAAELEMVIDTHRLKRVAAAANALAARYASRGEDVRIDVILIAPRCLPRPVTNVWQ